MSKKKFQVFISSTYRDLIEERQAAVEAVLQAGHFPVGMELFIADNQPQWDVIKKWIDESDVFLLILGGRYGSLSEVAKKSYVHIEYEYAINQGIRVIAVVLSNDFLQNKSKVLQDVFVWEKDFKEQYGEFKNFVLSNGIINKVEDKKDIINEVIKALHQFEMELFSGWVRVGDSLKKNGRISWEDYAELVKRLSSQIKQSGSRGGSEVDIIVGVNKGGLMTATFLTRYCLQQDTPVLALFADRDSGEPTYTSSKVAFSNLQIIVALKKAMKYKDKYRILLVDSISRDDKAMTNAYAYLEQGLRNEKNSVVIKTAQLIRDRKNGVKTDYCLEMMNTANVVFPYQRITDEH